MKKLKIYLDTSIISFYLADDSKEYQKVTREFFKNSHQYDIFVSEVVLFEIKKTNDLELRENLLRIVEKNDIRIQNIDEEKAEEIDSLVKEYIKEGIVPLKKIEDGYHIAIATVYEFDILLSWNFRHLASINKNVKINGVNRRMNYWKELKVITPLEVIGYG